MPLPQSQSFDGFGFVGYAGSGEHVVQSQCQKRKIGISERTQLEAVYENCDSMNEYHESIPKRQCQSLSCESRTLDFHEKESNGEDINMEEDREVIPTSEGDNSSSTSSEQMISKCCQDESSETLESSASMESECSPPESHHTPNRASAPWSISQEKVRRGVKPSPVSGRLYCHCSASWRGMYGLDAGYITDYY